MKDGDLLKILNESYGHWATPMFNEKKNTKEEFETQYTPRKIYLIVDVHCVTHISKDMLKLYRKLAFVRFDNTSSNKILVRSCKKIIHATASIWLHN